MRVEVYVAVDDIERSIHFYSELLDEPPVTKTDKYAAYRIGFGLVATSGYTVPLQRGNSAIPTLMVDDLDAIHARVTELAKMVTDIMHGADVRFFMFLDPDGNAIEVACPDERRRNGHGRE